MFCWPFRSPPLLVLFFACLGSLLALYPLARFRPPAWVKGAVRGVLTIALAGTIGLFIQEIRIGDLRQAISRGDSVTHTLPAFASLATSSYGGYRVLNQGLPYFIRAALSQKDDSLAREILPFSERLTTLEGSRWQWYDLARLYLKCGREQDARIAIQKSVDLMPLDKTTGAFLHYLNMLKAARATGRPLDSFWPRGQKIDFRNLEQIRD